MSLIKKLSAIICVLALLLTFTGCHKKNEIAVTVGDVEFTSAYYMCAFVTADTQAQQKVSESLSEEEQNSADVDIYSKKIDGKKYATWVKDTTISELKEIAAYKTLCKNNDLKLDKEKKNEAEQMADYYWSSYGYQSLLEPNGVSQNTYKNFMVDSYYSSVYFEYLYGKEGKEAISDEDVKKTLEENYQISNILEGSYTDSEGNALSDEAKAELKSKLEAYAEELTNGTRTFEEIYKEYNGIKDEETEEETTEETVEEEATENTPETEATAETAEETTEEDTEKELEPIDEYASLIGSEDTDYASDHFETVKKMELDEVKVIELKDDAGIVVVVKKDILSDPYYLENLDLNVRHLIKGDDFDKDIEKFAKTLDLKENTYATKQFKVKKIVYPESSY